jgi:hypothetical protein
MAKNPIISAVPANEALKNPKGLTSLASLTFGANG